MVFFYGLCVEPKICVVMELCKGTMEEYLSNRYHLLSPASSPVWLNTFSILVHQGQDIQLGDLLQAG
jgi:hypothetical protein